MVADGHYRAGLRTVFTRLLDKAHLRADLETAEAEI